jgi:transcriptional regulator with XRE-family HTH domain
VKFEVSREWLDRKLSEADDAGVEAGVTSLEQFRKDMEKRTVTPAVLAPIPTELGKVVRFIREQKGWTTSELAQIADVDEREVQLIESEATYDPIPRTVSQLADACHFSRWRFIELARHRQQAANENSIRFVARSKSLDTISGDEYESIRALVQTLLDHEGD